MRRLSCEDGLGLYSNIKCKFKSSGLLKIKKKTLPKYNTQNNIEKFDTIFQSYLFFIHLIIYFQFTIENFNVLNRFCFTQTTSQWFQRFRTRYELLRNEVNLVFQCSVSLPSINIV